MQYHAMSGLFGCISSTGVLLCEQGCSRLVYPDIPLPTQVGQAESGKGVSEYQSLSGETHLKVSFVISGVW